MLGKNKMIGFAPTCNPERAKTFYRDTLGLRLVSEELPFALVFDAGGRMLRVTGGPKLTPHPFTGLGWEGPDIDATAARLNETGGVFGAYQGMGPANLGIGTPPGGA